MKIAANGRLVTGIGSLPHPNIDSALAYSLQHSLPFLPQIPLRNPWEYMIPQALEGIPGLRTDSEGVCTLDPTVWAGRARALDARLEEAFRAPRERWDAYAEFEPSTATSSSWQPFLWELEERKIRAAKIQLCGPITAQSALRLTDGRTATALSDLTTQVFKLVLARASGMVRRLKSIQVQPIIFLDEPGLYALPTAGGLSISLWNELKLCTQTLQQEGAIVGLHCCSDSDWNRVLSLGIDVVSLDSTLSLETFLGSDPKLLGLFQAKGGILSLGVVPTPTPQGKPLNELDGRTLLAPLEVALGSYPALFRSALFTSACGLALHTPEQAEEVLRILREMKS